MFFARFHLAGGHIGRDEALHDNMIQDGRSAGENLTAYNCHIWGLQARLDGVSLDRTAVPAVVLCQL